MAHQNLSESDIRTPNLSLTTRCAILNVIWGSKYSSQLLIQDSLIGASYMRYYSEQCRIALHSKGLDNLIKTHADISDVIQQLKDITATRDRIKEQLRPRLLNLGLSSSDLENALGEMIDLCVRVWLMVDVGQL